MGRHLGDLGITWCRRVGTVAELLAFLNIHKCRKHDKGV
jgi:hypothetical protein